jgi:hypothetical protein
MIDFVMWVLIGGTLLGCTGLCLFMLFIVLWRIHFMLTATPEERFNHSLEYFGGLWAMCMAAKIKRQMGRGR